MLEIIHSIPSECSRCGSDNISGSLSIIEGHGNTVTCNACGTWMVLPDEEDDEVQHELDFGPVDITASFGKCPHCCSVGAIMEYGGEEVCQNCGLDPSMVDYDSRQIAHLWKEGSTIRKFLSKGRAMPQHNLGVFFRNFCGPHCSYAEDCDQGTGQFRQCYAESKSDILAITSPQLLQIEDSMGKKSRQKNRKRKQKEAEQRKKSAFVCATGGWFEKYMRRSSDETTRTEGSESTGS